MALPLRSWGFPLREKPFHEDLHAFSMALLLRRWAMALLLRKSLRVLHGPTPEEVVHGPTPEEELGSSAMQNVSPWPYS